MSQSLPPVTDHGIVPLSDGSVEVVGAIASAAEARPEFPALTFDEAQALTQEIRSTTVQLWALVLRAYEGHAWRVLGYRSWRAYVTREFQLSQSYAYRLLDHARVIRTLEAATNSPMGEIVTERRARALKPHIEDVAVQVGNSVVAGATPAEALEQAERALKERETRYTDSRKKDPRTATNREMVVRVRRVTADVLLGDVLPSADEIDWHLLDAELVPTWVEKLRNAARQILAFADQMEATR
jgi:hypothetical protein